MERWVYAGKSRSPINPTRSEQTAPEKEQARPIGKRNNPKPRDVVRGGGGGKQDEPSNGRSFFSSTSYFLLATMTRKQAVSQPHQPNQTTTFLPPPELVSPSTLSNCTPAPGLGANQPVQNSGNGAHAHRVTEDENGRAATTARAGVRLARAKAERCRNIVLFLSFASYKGGGRKEAEGYSRETRGETRGEVEWEV